MEKDEYDDDDGTWRCDCGTLNSEEDTFCGKYDKKKEDEDEPKAPSPKVPSLTENMTFRFPKRYTQY